MKKFMASLLVICLLFTGGISYFQVKDLHAQASAEAAAEETAEEAATPTLDVLALYQSHDPAEVVAICDGKDVTWQEYFYCLNNGISDVSSYISQMAMYGITVNWTDLYDEDAGLTFADLPASMAPDTVRQFGAISGYAAQQGITLSEENAAKADEQIASIKSSYLGEDATDEDLAALLMQNYLTVDQYKSLLNANYLYQQAFTDLYGEDGSAITDEDALAYLQDGGYVSATHILLMTKDSSTGDALDEDAVAEKLAKAQEIADELAAIEDPAERLARFNELKADLDEDTGKTYYPDGYTFTSGTMVTEFEDAVNALEDYEVSQPVETTYGYHVIMRLPLDPDAIVEYTSSGTPMTARSELANQRYGEELQAYYDGMTFTYADGFEVPVLADYIH